jgi:hypothetical protein
MCGFVSKPWSDPPGHRRGMVMSLFSYYSMRVGRGRERSMPRPPFSPDTQSWRQRCLKGELAAGRSVSRPKAIGRRQGGSRGQTFSSNANFWIWERYWSKVSGLVSGYIL